MPRSKSFKSNLDSQSDTARWAILQRKTQYHNAKIAFRAFSDVGLHPILIKGIAIARHYPDDQWRKFTDVDLAFVASEFDAAIELKSVTKFPFQPVDIHRELRHLDTVDWNDLFENSVVETIEGVNVRFLREEDHLRVICVHWLTDGGAYKDRLLDIYWAVTNRKLDFDWKRCLNVVSRNRRRWVILTIGLAHKYHGLVIEDLPFCDAAKRLPPWLIRALEKEWSSDVRLTPLSVSIAMKEGVWAQIVKRVPPNPIQATIEMEGSFDAPTRIHYQIGSILKRLGPSFKRIVSTVFRPKE